MILDLIKKDLVYVEKKFENKEEIFEYIYHDLLKKGYVIDEFEKAILDRECKFPTGLELSDEISIAIPHTDPEYAKKSFVSIMTLKESISFKKMDNPEIDTQVRIIIMLAIIENGKHMEILGELMNLIQDRDLIQAMLVANTSEGVINSIKEKLCSVM